MELNEPMPVPGVDAYESTGSLKRRQLTSDNRSMSTASSQSVYECECSSSEASGDKKVCFDPEIGRAHV